MTYIEKLADYTNYKQYGDLYYPYIIILGQISIIHLFLTRMLMGLLKKLPHASSQLLTKQSFIFQMTQIVLEPLHVPCF